MKILLLFILCSTLRAETIITYKFTYNTPRIIRKQFKSACQKWSVVYSSSVFFVKVKNKPMVRIIWDRRGHYIKLPYWLAQQEPDKIVFNAKRIKGFNFETIALHELGHTLGLPHNENNVDSIMYPIIVESKEPVITPDVIEFLKCGHYLEEGK